MNTPKRNSRNIVIAANIFTFLTIFAAPQLAAASPRSAGYDHGCDDGNLGYHKYLNTPSKGIDFHSSEFMQGYDDGYKACFSPNGSHGVTDKAHSESSDSDTGNTFATCNRSEHTTEYCNGYRAGAVDSDVHDDPDENITPSQVACKGDSPGSEYCAGYQQGYADEDHEMFSPH